MTYCTILEVEYTTTAEAESRISVTMNINRTYLNAYANSSSPEFQELSQEFSDIVSIMMFF